MTKPLSEQVAELEAKQHHLWDVKEAIRVENFELWSKNERLEAERDQLKADAISDLIKRQRLEVQVRNREAERDDLQRQVQEARDECDALRAGQGRWWQEEHPVPSLTLPRVITADDLRGEPIKLRDVRKGDVIDGYFWDITPGGVTLRNAVCTREVEDRTSFIEVEQSGETHQIGFSSIDVELRLVHRPEPTPPRLTVHALNIAPVGSVVSGRTDYLKKYPDAWISKAGFRWSSEDIVSKDPDATLTTPEAQ